jgi:hypothetical protein
VRLPRAGEFSAGAVILSVVLGLRRSATNGGMISPAFWAIKGQFGRGTRCAVLNETDCRLRIDRQKTQPPARRAGPLRAGSIGGPSSPRRRRTSATVVLQNGDGTSVPADLD